MPSALRIKELRDLNDNVMMSDGALTNNVDMSNVDMSNVSFPAGHVVQVVTDSKSHSGAGISVSGSGSSIGNASGYQIFQTGFTPKYSNSKIIIQTSNIHIEEQSNIGDWGWVGAWYDNTLVAFVYGSPSHVHFSGALNFTIHALNHSFSSWGTTNKNINIRGGMNGAGYIFHQNAANYVPSSPSTQTVGLTIMEVIQ